MSLPWKLSYKYEDEQHKERVCGEFWSSLQTLPQYSVEDAVNI